MFTDFEFKPENKSVYYTNVFKTWLKNNKRLSASGDIIWKRAKDIHKNARIAADKDGHICLPIPNDKDKIKNCFRSNDLNQGFVGNCWFVAAVSGLIENSDLFKKVVPFDNSFSDDSYNGTLKSFLNCLLSLN